MAIEHAGEALQKTHVRPGPAVLERMAEQGLGALRKPTTAEGLLRRQEASWTKVAHVVDLPEVSPAVAEQVEIDVKYAGYIERAERQALADKKLDRIPLPEGVDWSVLTTLSTEVRERLSATQPKTLAQAASLPGITPAAINALSVWLAKSLADNGAPSTSVG